MHSFLTYFIMKLVIFINWYKKAFVERILFIQFDGKVNLFFTFGIPPSTSHLFTIAIFWSFFWVNSNLMDRCDRGFSRIFVHIYPFPSYRKFLRLIIIFIFKFCFDLVDFPLSFFLLHFGLFSFLFVCLGGSPIARGPVACLKNGPCNARP